MFVSDKKVCLADLVKRARHTAIFKLLSHAKFVFYVVGFKNLHIGGSLLVTFLGSQICSHEVVSKVELSCKCFALSNYGHSYWSLLR